MKRSTRVAAAALVGLACLASALGGESRKAGGEGGKAAGGKTPRNPLGVRVFSLNAWEQAGWEAYSEALWQHVPSIGLRYVFINVPAPEAVAAVEARLASSGLKVAIMRGTAELTSTAALAPLEKQFATCQQMGVRRMFLSPKHPGVPKEQVYALLRQVGELARRYQVVVCLETHPDLGANADEHLATMQAVDHPNIRVNFDTGNITYYNEGRDAVAELKKIVNYVAAVDIKDHGGKLTTWNFPPLGHGVVDIPGVLAVLREHGYRGPITMEIEGVEGVSRSLADIERQLGQSAAYVQSLGDFR